MTAPKTLARTAGVLYLLLAGAAFNEGYVLPRIVKPGDATATADNIRASATLFRLGTLGDFLAGVLWVLLAMVLYLLLRHVNRPAAGAMVTFAAIGGGIQCLNQLNQYTALKVATGTDYHSAFGGAGADAVTLLFTGLQSNGYLLDTMYFGLWLAPLGYLALKSGYFPRVIGILLIAACAGYLADFFTAFVAPSLAAGVFQFVTTPAAAAGELTLLLWLLIRGTRTPTSDIPVREPAGTSG